MKKIAIKGHPTRGEDIIKILESLGGINKLHLQGNQCAGCYYVENDNSINCKSHFYVVNEYNCYTLEEYEQTFLKVMEKIAIEGHPTRGAEVVKTLESLGGINGKEYLGNDTHFYYYINTRNFIDCEPDENLPQEYKKYTIEEYEQKLLNTMKNKRTIQIDLNTAREWYKQGGDLRKVALQAFTESEINGLPKSWEEYCKINSYLDKDKAVFLLADGNINPLSSSYCARINLPGAVPSKKRAEQFLTLNKLLQIRDCYNQGWKPNWKDSIDKYVIWSFENELHLDVSTYASSLFAFKSEEVRDTFFENFEKDLETIKEFL